MSILVKLEYTGLGLFIVGVVSAFLGFGSPQSEVAKVLSVICLIIIVAITMVVYDGPDYKSPEFHSLAAPQTASETRVQVAKSTSEEEAVCNKCGTSFLPIQSSFHPSQKVEVSWGYESTGKDTERDCWNLCPSCYRNDFGALPPICVKCHKTIPEVMAYLSSENPHTSFYLDYPPALQYFQNRDNHCGFEYAMVGNQVLCEICYEDYVRTFKVPISVTCYMGGGHRLLKEMNQKPDRIQQSRDFVLTEDCLRDFYSARASREDTLKIRNDVNKHQLIENLYVEIFKDDFREEFPDLVSFQTGDKTWYRVGCQVLKDLAAAALINHDFTHPRLSPDGSMVSFGSNNWDFSSQDLIDLALEYQKEHPDE